MSTYEEFVKALEADEELQAKCIELSKDIDPKTEEELYQVQSEVAAKLGFDVPATEFKLAQLVDEEIDEDQLKKVSGGSRHCQSGFKSCGVGANHCILEWRCITIMLHPTTTCDSNFECNFNDM